MLKQLKLFFFFYNKALKTNVYYFVCPIKLLSLMSFVFSKRLITFYYVKNSTIFVYLPKFSSLIQSYNFKHYRVYHNYNQIKINGFYLTSGGFLLGNEVKKKKIGGRLLYIL